MTKKKVKNSTKKISSVDNMLKKLFMSFAVAFVLVGGIALFTNHPQVNVLGASVTPVPTSTVCQKNNPVISVFPSQFSIKTGSTVTYYVKVTNRDRGNCLRRTFNLSKKLPGSTWFGTFDSASFNLLPGKVKSVAFKVKSPSNAAVKSYTSLVLLNNSSATVKATYNIHK